MQEVRRLVCFDVLFLNKSPPLVRLFQTKPSVLEALKERGFKFEVVPGMNGRVWVDSTHLYHTIAIANAITLSEFMTDKEIHRAVQKIGDTVMS